MNQVDSSELGFLTGHSIKEVDALLRNGIFQLTSILPFMVVSRTFFERVASYLLERCPLRVDLLPNATWIDFKERLSKTFSSVEYFIFRFPSLLNHLDIDSVHDQFLS